MNMLIRIFIACLIAFMTTSVFAAKGFYVVPMEDQSLFSSSVYEIDYSVVEFKNLNRFQFTLPKTLTGIEKKFVVERSDTENSTFVGKNVNALCTLDKEESIFSCQMNFENLNINDVLVEIAVKDKFKDQSEIERRLKVARKFSGDPIGTLHYKVPPESY
jgi:hypothetical protein